MDETYTAPQWQTVDVREIDPETAAATADDIMHRLGYARTVQALTAELSQDPGATSRTIGVSSHVFGFAPKVFRGLRAAGEGSTEAYREGSVYPAGSQAAYEMFNDMPPEACVPEEPAHLQPDVPGPSGYFRVEKMPDASTQVSVGYLDPATNQHSVLVLPPLEQ